VIPQTGDVIPWSSGVITCTIPVASAPLHGVTPSGHAMTATLDAATCLVDAITCLVCVIRTTVCGIRSSGILVALALVVVINSTMCHQDIVPMPLPLTDPRWTELRGSYGRMENVVAWLTEAQQEGGLSQERLGDLINEVQHQGGTSTAMYAVATYLVDLARRAKPENAIYLLIQSGLIYSASTQPKAVPCPAFLKEEFTNSASDGAKMLAPLLTSCKDFDSFKWAVEALAGFIGLHEFARFLDGLDFYEGRIYHDLIDGPFPGEDAP
jgi:hypothetical protein